MTVIEAGSQKRVIILAGVHGQIVLKGDLQGTYGVCMLFQ